MELSALPTRLPLSLNRNPKHRPSHSCSTRPHLFSPITLRCSPPLHSGSSSTVAAAVASAVDSSTDGLDLRLRCLADEFRSLPQPIDRVKRLLLYATDLPPFPDADRIPSNRVAGCTAQVWLSAWIDALGRMRFSADSDSEITRGFCSCLLAVFDGAHPQEVLAVNNDDLADINVFSFSARSRVHTWQNVLVSMKKKARELVAELEGRLLIAALPPLVIGGAKKGYAEAQVNLEGHKVSFLTMEEKTRGIGDEGSKGHYILSSREYKMLWTASSLITFCSNFLKEFDNSIIDYLQSDLCLREIHTLVTPF